MYIVYLNFLAVPINKRLSETSDEPWHPCSFARASLLTHAKLFKTKTETSCPNGYMYVASSHLTIYCYKKITLKLHTLQL